ncbi:Cytochrome oxidase assembly protein [Microbacterium esteraromaticum]|uniref:Cytochrome oxidase assembly protein n=1 Tax=Microbacterium esteraromaticum TaxID=57043 RepID=A0A1R4IXR8_9MICO|nr:COX15/CtaA family protein [Microbacterium esteraromaticum]SJN24365.1 Cytochrome oxidase assembly protein [Microbacterium esteraromaticum]
MPETRAPESSAAESRRSPAHSPAPWSRALRIFAWLSFITETIIIGTGGAVRLTGSGLGCSEWPLCTPDSLVPTPEQGIHGLIEFGNRTMTGVVGIIAIAVVLVLLFAIGGKRALTRALWFAGAGVVLAGIAYAIAAPLHLPAFPIASAVLLLVSIIAAIDSVRGNNVRRDLNVLAWITLVGVVAQAFVGGITVLTGLNPFIVGFHYVSSLLLVCVTAAFLVRMYAAPGPRERAVPVWFSVLGHITGLALALTILFGVLTTGSGPHSGDADVLRHGFDATVLAHVHSWPGYILAGLVAVLLVSAWALKLDVRRWMLVLAAAILVQVLVGVWQAREGLPALLVGIHMVLAALSAAAYTVVVMHLKRPVDATD